MNKRLTRHDMTQPDEFVTTVEHAVLWFERNWRKVAMAVGAVLAAVIVIWAAAGWTASRGRAGDALLGEAMGLMSAPLLAPGELPPLTGEAAFSSARERDEAVLARLDEVLAKHPSSKAAISARYLRGAILLRLERFDEARETLTSFLEARPGSDLAPAAQRTLASVEMAAGNPEEAVTILRELAAHPATLFPEDAALMELARALEAAGSKEEALETYRRIATESPESIFATEAGQAVARLTQPGNDA